MLRRRAANLRKEQAHAPQLHAGLPVLFTLIVLVHAPPGCFHVLLDHSVSQAGGPTQKCILMCLPWFLSRLRYGRFDFGQFTAEFHQRRN